jgi:predicted RND superfamily exporter protein
MYQLAKFIVEKRKLFFIVFLGLSIASIFAMLRVNINYDLTKYLPDESQTKIALDVMEEEFGLNGVANIIIDDISVEEAMQLRDEFSKIEGVLNAAFENNEEYYKDGTAMIKVSLVEGDYAKSTETAIYAIKDLIEVYDVELSGSSVTNIEQQEDVNREMAIILAIAVPIIILILILNANSYAEILVFGIVIGASVLLNKGTNIFLGEISYVTNSIAIVLQLALAMDYSIILLHRFEEEKQNYPDQEAIIHALKHSFTSISASSMTTIFGLISIMFMQFSIGFDIGMVLAKSILCSLFSVFFFMPGVLLVFAKWIKKTQHKKFMPDFNFISKYVVKTRLIMPIILLVIISAAFTLQLNNTFSFSMDEHKTSQYSEKFGKTNTLAIIVPKGDEEAEREVMEYILNKPFVNQANGLMSLGIRNQLTTSQFAEALAIDKQAATGIYAYYYQSQSPVNSVPLIELINFIQTNSDLVGLTEAQILAVNQLESVLAAKGQAIDVENFATMLGLEVEQATLIYHLYEVHLNNPTIPVDHLIQFLVNQGQSIGLSNEDITAIIRIKGLMDASQVELNPTQFSHIMGMTQTEATQIYTMYEIETQEYNGIEVGSHLLVDILPFMLNHQIALGLSESQVEELQMSLQIIGLAGQSLTSEAFASLLGIEQPEVQGLYASYLAATEVPSPHELEDILPFILANEQLPLDQHQKGQLNQLNLVLDLESVVNVKTVAHMMQIEQEEVSLLFSMFEVDQTNQTYTLVEMVNFLAQNGAQLGLQESQVTEITKNKVMLDQAVEQFESDDYARMMFNLDLAVDDQQALTFIRELRTDLKDYYDEFYVLGDSANIVDIKDSFISDVLLVNTISILSIFIILALSFKSFLIPFLLVLVIQGSIWMNFSLSTITSTPIIFMGYIIVTAIQMGATIDYAIVMTERYKGFRRQYPKFEAVHHAIRVSLPTLLTSGGILVVSGFSVGLISSVTTISSLGILMGRGALISCLMVIFLLPQLLLIFDKIVYKKKRLIK